MANHDTCPTCGTKTSPLHRAEMRLCSACRRTNPVGFLYCGYCAAPMENTEIRARVAEVAAPEGGWPNLASEMLEVKFFLQQGELDEAYELLSILQRRYPGHPELADLVRRGAGNRVDADVEGLVDSVLAGSAALAGKAARRRATRWEAPTVGSREPTSVQDVVEPQRVAAPPPAVPPVRTKPPVQTKPPSQTRPPVPTKPPVQAQSKAESAEPAKPVRERTTVYRQVGPKPSRSGLTIAVDALQPAAPFADVIATASEPPMPAPAAAATEQAAEKPAKRKRTVTARNKQKVGGRAERRGLAFGAGVLGRFGR